MQNDPIIKELHKIREDHLKLFNFDFKAAFNDLKKQEQKGGRKIAKPTVLKTEKYFII